MTDILAITAEKAAVIRSSTRILFLVLGVSLIIAEMLYTPIRPLWMVAGYIFGAILILFSIVGLSPKMRVSGLGKVINNTTFHIIVSFVLGMAIIIAAMVHPPVREGWFAYFNLVGVLLVFDSIITSSWHVVNGAKKLRKTDHTKHLHPHA